MQRMKWTMKVTNKCLMKEQIKARFLYLISNAYVMLLCRQIFQLSSYPSVESFLYTSVMLTRKEGK